MHAYFDIAKACQGPCNRLFTSELPILNGQRMCGCHQDLSVRDYPMSCDLVRLIDDPDRKVYEVQSTDYEKHTAVIAKRWGTPRDEQEVSINDLEMY